MNRPWPCSALLLAGLLAGPTNAHHSYAPFDRTRELTLEGTVRTWEMGNPHAYLWLYVINAKGGRDIWGFEAPAPTVLIRNGWKRDSLKVGDRVVATLNPLRDGRRGGLLVTLRLPDGRLIDTRPGDRPKPPAAGTPAVRP